MPLIYRGDDMGSVFGLSDDFAKDAFMFEHFSGLIKLIWNRTNKPAKLKIDGEPFRLAPQEITSTTYLHRLEWSKDCPPLTVLTFNREFYCIQDHDHEVSCNGILFFGTQQTPVIQLDQEEARKFDLLYQVFVDEFEQRDDIQGEMLRMLLKRFIIKTTRLAREHSIYDEMDHGQVELIRKFNVLVDLHFREKKKVRDYAGMLFKSPKTLSNLFSNNNHKSPLAVIHERIVLEAKRLLLYTDKSAKEIAFELGYEEAASFHKLFKKGVGMTPQQFKNAQFQGER